MYMKIATLLRYLGYLTIEALQLQYATCLDEATGRMDRTFRQQ